MLVKFSRSGPFLGCSRYPECKATRPMGGEPRSPAVETEHACPKCGKPLVQREGKRGPFLSCSGYPDCKESYKLDDQEQLLPLQVETEHVCQKCGKPMVLRQGSRGAFLGCTGYPKCRNTMPVDDAGQPVATITVDANCSQCGGPMKVCRGRRGAFLGCMNYPKCRGTAPLPDELKEEVAKSAPASNGSAAADLKAIDVEETCENCGGPMIVRRGRRGYFLGCSHYPKCKGTREPGNATLEKITAVVGG
jgi:DNA topoisomerase-1